jgi:cold shock CspA family protein
MNEQRHEQASEARHFGKLRVWESERGYGFLDCEMSDGKSFFLHIKQVQESQRHALVPGVFLEFSPLKTDKGWSAMRAVVLE